VEAGEGGQRLKKQGIDEHNSNCVDFMREIFDEELTKVYLGLVRGESGFDTDETVSALKDRGRGFHGYRFQRVA
jgi:hypothetical protein